MTDRTGEDFGLDPAELTPRVRAALERLSGERDALARRLAEVERLADRDPLIPVLNRRAFVRELGRTAAFCARYAAPASLVYLDLDGFKGVNDRFGHAAGDAALAVVGDVLASNVRETDLVGRLGGDEFAVILVQAELDAARAKADGLAALIAAEAVVFEGRTIALQASAGVRAWEPGLDAARWLAEADAAMFVAKGVRG